MNKDVVYFHLNNWFAGDNYPAKEPFNDWMQDLHLWYYFSNDDWCKKNKLCVIAYPVDMSISYNITASREWVEKNCPSILNEDSNFQIDPTIIYDEDEEEISYPASYDENIGFLEYNENNFGVHFIHDEDYDEDEDDDD